MPAPACMPTHAHTHTHVIVSVHGSIFQHAQICAHMHAHIAAGKNIAIFISLYKTVWG